MRPKFFFPSSVALVLVVASWTQPGRTLAHDKALGMKPPGPTAEARYQISKISRNLKMGFEVNQGQADDDVRFIARGDGYNLFLTPVEAVLALKPAGKSPLHEKGIRGSSPFFRAQMPDRPSSKSPAVLRFKLLGASSNTEMTGIEGIPTTSNYFIGNDPRKWRTKVPTFAKVKQSGIYPGVDLVYYRNRGQLEFDFEISPGVDPGAITISFQDADTVELDATGNVVLGFCGEYFNLRRPLVYQERGTSRKEIDGDYVIKGKNLIGFHVKGDYNRDISLTIDPVLVYSTYLGGTGEEFGSGIAVDQGGNSYVIGTTASVDFPIKNPLRSTIHGSSDVFVTKIDATGSSLVYSTYLGGSSYDGGTDVAVDASGNVYLTGLAGSADFPTVKPLQPSRGSDSFVAKLDSTGSVLVYSTYLGGTGSDLAHKIALDSSNNVYVTGQTDSLDFPTKNAAQPLIGSMSGKPAGGGYYEDAFVTKLNASGSALVYSTYLGGKLSDIGNGIAVDASGAAYVTGQTDSTDFPVVHAFQPFSGEGPGDAFIAKFSPDGSTLVYSTYLGGTLADAGSSIAVDQSGMVTATGWTSSRDFPTMNAMQATHPGDPALSGNAVTAAFVTRLNPAGSGLIYSTFLGGSDGTRGTGLAVDRLGNAYITGVTASVDLPVVNAAQHSPGESLIFKSTDGGTSWSRSDNGISIRRIYGHGFGIRALAIDPATPTTLYAGTTFGVYKTANGGRTWNPSSTGIPSDLQVAFLAVSPTTPPTLFALVAARANEYAPRFGVFKSSDGGASWATSNHGFPVAETGAITAEVTNIAVDPRTPSRVYAATSWDGVYKSDDNGSNWTAINTGLPRGVSLLAIDQVDSAVIYAATNGDGIFRSTNGGGTWAPTPTRFPLGNTIFGLRTDPKTPYTLYVLVAAAGIYKTIDGGTSWTPLSGMGDGVYAFVLDPATPSTLYAATYQGIYKSTNGGILSSERVFETMDYESAFRALAIDPVTPSTLYVAAIGQSMGDAFAAKLNTAGSALIYSTFLGGRTIEQFSSSIALDILGNAYITGTTRSPDFPTATPAQSTHGGSFDTFVTKISPTIETNFAQFANGADFVSSLVLTNPSRTDQAEGRVSFFDDEGRPLSLSINGSSPQSTTAFSLSPLGGARLTTDGAGSLIAGSVRVSTTTPVGGEVEFAYPGLGTAGVGESDALVEFMTPVVNDARRGLYTGIAISNPQARDIDLRLSLRRLDGLELPGGSISERLAGHGHLAKYVRQLFPNASLEGFDGILVATSLTSGARVNATALQLGSFPGEMTTLPVVSLDPVPASNELFFAQFGNGSNLTSSLFLTNPLSSATSGEINFSDDEGNALAVSVNGQPPAARVPFSIEPFGGAVFTTDGQGSIVTGSARVVAGKAIGGVLRFSVPGLGIAGVGASIPMAAFITPVRNSLARNLGTGIAITSVGSPVGLTLTLRDRKGQQVQGGEAKANLQTRGHLAGYVRELFPGADVAEFEGTLTVSAEGGKVAATAIELGLKTGEFTTLPVAEVK